MKKNITKTFLSLLFACFLLIASSRLVNALDGCSNWNVGVTGNSPFGQTIPQNAPPSTSFTFSIGPLIPNKAYHLLVSQDRDKVNVEEIIVFTPASANSSPVNYEVTLSKTNHPAFFQNIGKDEVNYLILKSDDVDEIRDCVLGSYTIKSEYPTCQWNWSVPGFSDRPGCVQIDEDININVVVYLNGTPAKDGSYFFLRPKCVGVEGHFCNQNIQERSQNGSVSFTLNPKTIQNRSGSLFFNFYKTWDTNGNPSCVSPTIAIKNICNPEERKQVTSDGLKPYELCSGLPGSDSDITTPRGKCNNCLLENNGIWTALGCIKTDPKEFISDFLKIAIGIAGGIALLLMVYGAFLVSVSAGDPKKATEGKEIITGTIAGLLFIIFSVVLLKLIGVDILKIPGL